MDKRTIQYKQTEEHREEIKAWLNSEERDFDQGYNLFVRFSHNRALALMLARTQRHSKLVYELEKIAERPFIKHSPVMPLKTIANAGKRHQENVEAEKIVKSAGKSLEFKAEDIVDEKLSEMESGADDVIQEKLDELNEAADDVLKENIQIVREGRIVKLGDLPEALQELWKQNRDEHKLMRAVHEKMKLAKADQERAEFRKQLVAFDDKISDRWAVIDEWFEGGEEKGESEKAKVESEEKYEDGSLETEVESKELKPESMEDLKAVNAARSYVSRNLKKVKDLDGEKREKLVAKLNERLEILFKHKAEIKPETKAEMAKLGLIEDNGNQ